MPLKLGQMESEKAFKWVTEVKIEKDGEKKGKIADVGIMPGVQLVHACRHLILYPLEPELLFPNDAIIWKPKINLGPNLVKLLLDRWFW